MSHLEQYEQEMREKRQREHDASEKASLEHEWRKWKRQRDELLSACKALVEWATDLEADDTRTTLVLNRAVAAIAKAEGK